MGWLIFICQPMPFGIGYHAKSAEDRHPVRGKDAGLRPPQS